MRTDIEDRLMELEARCAYQDDAMQTLSDAIAHQRQDIEALETLCRQLRQQVANRFPQDLDPSTRPGDPADEIPPHW